MGRTFPSIRRGVNSTADRWARSARWLKREDQKYGEQLVELAKTHSSEAFAACDDPLEAVVFSALVEILKRQDELEADKREHVDP
jgi:nucleotide-binding universal stress UspA family protein